MSSVPKWKQGKSPAEFLKVAREVKIMTVRKSNKIPHKLWRGMAEPMIRQANDAKSLIIQGNSINPQNRREAEDRKRCFKNARAILYSLGSNVDDLLEIKEEISIGYEAIDEWTAIITKLILLMDGVMDSDARRYRELPE